MKRNALLLVCFFTIQSAVFAQGLSPEFYKNRREAVRRGLPDSSFALLFSAPVHSRSNDVEYTFHQDPDFYYLTGITYSNAFILLFKNPIKINNLETNEVLFIHDRNPKKEIWRGAMLDTGLARKNSGIHCVMYASQFMSSDLDSSALKKMFFKWPKGVVDSKSDTLDLFDQLKNVKEKFKTFLINSESILLTDWIADLRSIKQPEEIAAMRKAISISCDGHNEMMKYAKPGLYEYNVQAVGEYIFRSEGAEAVGYPSICGAGANSCVLHYDANRSLCSNGSLLLLDMGAEYHGYSADITRTFPVNGKFSENQKAIYQLVFEAQEAAFRMCAAGNAFRDPHKAAVEVIKKGLIALGIIDTESAYDKYFIHGTSHYLGLDVHDAGNYGNLKAGNVITVEPGIYIAEGSKCDPKWWNIGVRIEDDVLITADGYEILSTATPRKPLEIEALMSKRSLFNK